MKNFYNILNITLIHQLGTMLVLHSGFILANKRYIDDYIQYFPNYIPLTRKKDIYFETKDSPLYNLKFHPNS